MIQQKLNIKKDYYWFTTKDKGMLFYNSLNDTLTQAARTLRSDRAREEVRIMGKQYQHVASYMRPHAYYGLGATQEERATVEGFNDSRQ